MLDDLLQGLIDLLLWLPRFIYEMVAGIVIFFIDLIPAYSVDIQGALNSWPSDVLYFMGIIEADYGITAIFTALGARFILRRVPVIG